MLKNFLLVGIGGALGSMMRYALQVIFRSSMFPFATLFVNIAGSFAFGLLLGLGFRDNRISENWKLFLATGLCGGFTTFSAFSAENMQMMQNGKYFLSAVYIVSSVFSGIAGTWLGYKFFTN